MLISFCLVNGRKNGNITIFFYILLTYGKTNIFSLLHIQFTYFQFDVTLAIESAHSNLGQHTHVTLLPVNTGTVPRISKNRFLPHPYKFIINQWSCHLSTYNMTDLYLFNIHSKSQIIYYVTFPNGAQYLEQRGRNPWIHEACQLFSNSRPILAERASS
jgi:hypothetical protein